MYLNDADSEYVAHKKLFDGNLSPVGATQTLEAIRYQTICTCDFFRYTQI